MYSNKKMRFLLVNFALILISNFTFGQANEIKIRFIGNCGLSMTDGTTNFYIDFPYKSGAHNYMEYDKSEIENVKENAIFIFTHRHADHYSSKILKKLSGQKFDPWNIEELEKLSGTIPDFAIKAFKTDHTVFGISFKHYSYLVIWHGKKIFLSGDTTNSETIASQTDLDWAFVPIWLLMDAKEKNVDLKILSKKYAIYHIGQNDKITLDEKDSQLKLLDKQGDVITIAY